MGLRATWKENAWNSYGLNMDVTGLFTGTDPSLCRVSMVTLIYVSVEEQTVGPADTRLLLGSGRCSVQRREVIISQQAIRCGWSDLNSKNTPLSHCCF